MSWRRHLAPALIGILSMSTAVAVAQIDPFYLDVERDAQATGARGDAAAAARLYRIACFGMLDEPARLAACTVRLALAQHAAADREGFRESFSRLATVEERFQGLTLAEITVQQRREFAQHAAAWLPAEALRAIPELAALTAADAKPAGAREAKAREAKARETRRSEPAAAAPPEAVAAKPETLTKSAPPAASSRKPANQPAPATAPASVSASPERVVPPPSPLPLTSAELERIATARALFAGAAERADLEREIAALREIAERHPGHPEAAAIARLTGDLAYRAAAWPLCAESYLRAGDPGPEAPLGRFYMAVCLYEAGQRQAAAEILAPSVDRLKRSPFVDGYLTKILGAPGRP